MHAIVLSETGGPDQLVWQEITTPKPGAGEVLLKIHACAVCYRDIIDRVGRFPFIQLPVVPGHEFAGEVIETGPGVTRLSIGDHVVNMLRSACGHCGRCLAGRTMHCENAMDMFGLTANGGYSEFAAVSQNALVRVPKSIPLPQAATVMCTAGTALQGMRTRGALQAGEKVVIAGASGGVGMAAIQIARIMGAYVIAVTGSEKKRPMLEEAGAHEVIVDSKGSFHKEINMRHPGGVDMAFDAVGAPTFNASLRSVRADGRVVLVGNITGESLSVNPGLLVVKGLSILASDGSTPRDLEDIFGWMERGQYKAYVQEEMPMARAADAHRMLENRAVVGRIVLRP